MVLNATTRLLFVLSLMMGAADTAPAQVGLTFSFDNVAHTADGLAFDVVVMGAQPGTRLGDTQVYLNYNEAAFGEAVAHNGHIAVTLAPALQAHGRYRPPVVNDNTASRVSITTEYVGQPEAGLALPADAGLVLMRVVLTPTDAAAPPELGFDARLMAGQQFEADMATVYAPLLLIPLRPADAIADTLHDATGTIRQVSAGLIALVPDARPATRYVPQNLPEGFQQDGLRVVFSGWLEEIPPNVRMIGQPLVLTALRRQE